MFLTREIRLFWEMVKRSFQRYMTYRAAALAGLFTNFGFGMMRIAIFVALYGEQQEVEGISVQAVITYAALSQAVIAYLSVFGWYDLMLTVYNGDVSSDLLKPMSYYRFWMAQDLGRMLVSLLLRGVTIMIIYELFWDMAHPETAVQWLILIISIILSWLISFTWRFLINLAAFWTPNAKGICRFFFVLAMFFSGLFMPIRFFPDWVQAIVNLTPFPYMLNTVVEIYVNVLTGPAAWEALLLQAFWVVVLMAAGQWVLQTAVRRLVILGG
ncbi:MAG: ABC-2 family transporter protein [Chloroflexota bacterium]